MYQGQPPGQGEIGGILFVGPSDLPQVVGCIDIEKSEKIFPQMV